MKRKIWLTVFWLIVVVFCVFSARALFYYREVTASQTSVIGVNRNIESGEVESVVVRLRGVSSEIAKADVRYCDQTWSTLREGDEIVILSFMEYWNILGWIPNSKEYERVFSLEVDADSR